MSFRIFLVALAIAAIAPSVGQAQNKAKAQKAKSFDFVQTAREFAFASDTLTLAGLGEYVIYMAERPDRNAGQITTEQFLKSWSGAKNAFAKDAPNASLSWVDNGAVKVAVMTLTDPALAPEAMRYKVKVLFGSLPPKGSAATLFIDTGGLMQLVAYGAQ